MTPERRMTNTLEILVPDKWYGTKIRKTIRVHTDHVPSWNYESNSKILLLVDFI